MKKLLNHIFLGLLLCTVFACQEENLLQVNNSIGLESHTVTQISGAFTIDESKIIYDVHEEEDDTYQISIEIDQKLLEATVNYEEFSIAVDGHENTLRPEQMLALNKGSIAIAEYIFELQGANETEFEMTAAENSIVQVMDYFSQAPVGFVFSRFEVRTDDGLRSTRNDAIRCVRRERRYAIAYDTRNHGVVHAVELVGEDKGQGWSCMGRCGGGCGRWRWLPSAWTLDCLEHDACGFLVKSKDKGKDPDCGDEYREAIDDWTFGVIRGCTGSRG